MKRSPRNFHKLAIIRRRARGHTAVIPSKKTYKRHPKHKNGYGD